MQAQTALFDDLPPARRPRSAPALVRKANGQWLASKKAGSKWREDMLLALRRYLLGLRRGEDTSGADIGRVLFTFDGFRMWCDVRGLDKPASVNAWGTLPAAAVRAGLCKWSGDAVAALRAESHGRLVKLWVAA